MIVMRTIRNTTFASIFVSQLKPLLIICHFTIHSCDTKIVAKIVFLDFLILPQCLFLKAKNQLRISFIAKKGKQRNSCLYIFSVSWSKATMGWLDTKWKLICWVYIGGSSLPHEIDCSHPIWCYTYI